MDGARFRPNLKTCLAGLPLDGRTAPNLPTRHPTPDPVIHS